MLTLNWMARSLFGREAEGLGQPVREVVIDSRRAGPGSVFVALPGERVDGHDFVAAALSQGALGAIVSRPVAGLPLLSAAGGPEQVKGPVGLLVPDPLAALQALGAAWRQTLTLPVIGITGSVGKTTTKDVTAAVLSSRYRTLKTEGNLNNEIGLPLQLLRLRAEHEVAVLEMGFYAIGEIAQLCAWARPTIGIVNNVYAVHLERAGSIEAIVQGKGELVEALPADGIAILNADEPRVLGMAARTRARVMTYGLAEGADVRADQIVSRGLEGIRFRLHAAGERLMIKAPLLGAHSVHTALRAIAAGLALGLTWDEIVRGLQMPDVAQMRLSTLKGPNGSLLIDDTYNASPESTIAALNLLAELEGRKLAVIGDMLELGAEEERAHRLVGRRAREVVDVLITVGPRAHLIAHEAREAGLPAAAVIEVEDANEALSAVRRVLAPGDMVLLKASRGIALDRVARALSEEAGGC